MKLLLAFRKTVSNSRVSSKTESSIKLLLYFLECPPLIGIQKNPQNVHVIGRSRNSYRITGGFRNNFRVICGFFSNCRNRYRKEFQTLQMPYRHGNKKFTFDLLNKSKYIKKKSFGAHTESTDIIYIGYRQVR